jgi:hypothetical protein
VLAVETSSLDRRGVAWGGVAVAIVVALTFVGSDGLAWFDAALVGYLFGVVLAIALLAWSVTFFGLAHAGAPSRRPARSC